MAPKVKYTTGTLLSIVLVLSIDSTMAKGVSVYLYFDTHHDIHCKIHPIHSFLTIVSLLVLQYRDCSTCSSTYSVFLQGERATHALALQLVVKRRTQGR